MSVRCAKCGEELMGAVNRCWKCGQAFARRPESDGLPPVRYEAETLPQEPLEATVLEGEVAEAAESAVPAAIAVLPEASGHPPMAAAPRAARLVKRPAPASDIVEVRRQSAMAMGGTVASLALGIFALLVAPFRFEAAIIAVLGLIMGVWGLYSSRRGLALLAMLLCCIGIGIGTYSGAKALYILIEQNRPIDMQEDDLDEPQ